MKERPIILNTEMVRATLEGRKTQTRRVIKPQPQLSGGQWLWRNCSWTKDKPHCPTNTLELPIDYCPYGQVGDRLWVRESFLDYPVKGCLYKADYNTKRIELADDAFCVPQWKPSIHMPRWASRITLEITGIRVERVQEIGFRDCEAAGIYIYDDPWKAKGLSVSQCRMRFARLWDSLNAKRGYSWESNPWVWVISFKRI